MAALHWSAQVKAKSFRNIWGFVCTTGKADANGPFLAYLEYLESMNNLLLIITCPVLNRVYSSGM